VNDEFRGRNPDESTEQWLARSSVEYHDAWDAVRIQQRGRSPFLDDGYDGAMDRLQAADNERGNAAIALDRERRNIARAAGMQANVDRRLASEPSFGPSRRPVSEDFRGDDKVVDWARFRAVMSAWDAAHAPPGAVQNPFTNLPPS